MMKVDGVHGDFIVYNKPQDTQCPVRISFMIQEDSRGSEPPKCKAQKVKLKKTETQNDGRPGFALDTVGFIKWFDTMSELVDYYKNDPIHPFKRPYFYSGVDARPSAPIQVTPSVSPTPNRPKPKYPSLPRPDPASPKKLPSRPSTLDRLKPQILPEISSESETDSDDDGFKPADIPPSPTLPMESPIIYDHPDIKSLLDGKCEGSYVIHKDKNKNSETNPYTIYAVKPSKRTGENRIQTAQIHFDRALQKYKVGTALYATVDAFLESNASALKFNSKFDRPHYINPHELINPERFKAQKEENPYVEHYKK